METPHIRPLEEAEAEVAAEVSAACFAQPWSAPALREEASRAGSVARIARLGERVVGYAILRVVLDEAELLTIGVLPDARGAGVGRALLEAARADAVARGVRRVHLEVRADDPVARGLYLSAGFEDVGRRRGYYADGADAALMTWEATGRTPPPGR